MRVRDNLLTAMNGGEPETTPLSAYASFFDNIPEDDYRPLVDMGLGITMHISTVEHVRHGLEREAEQHGENGRDLSFEYWKTPIGTLRQGWTDGWHSEHFIKSPADYKVMQWVVENTELLPRYEQFIECDEKMGDWGMALVAGSRTPAMAINVELAGTERFCMDVATGVEELFDLYEAMKKQLVEETKIIAKGPGPIVKWMENLTISMLGPQRYAGLLTPVYEECMPIYEEAGKRVLVHYDGALSAIKDEIGAAPFHGLESLTEPPEGDMTYDECRAAWPDKVFWGNINVGLFGLPPERLAEEVVAKRRRAGKRGVAFEISEDLPATWRESIPVVLEALAQLG